MSACSGAYSVDRDIANLLLVGVASDRRGELYRVSETRDGLAARLRSRRAHQHVGLAGIALEHQPLGLAGGRDRPAVRPSGEHDLVRLLRHVPSESVLHWG